jgi:hypothetical protein
MTASWNGAVALAEADAKPGHYYVSVRDARGRHALVLGPFTQRRPGRDAHARALGRVRDVRRYIGKHDWRNAPWLEYGTAHLELGPDPPRGKLNDALEV